MNGITNQRAPSVPGRGGRRKGRLVHWEDSKGFGWVEAEGERIFAHIREFDSGQPRPETGDEVTFLTGLDARGRTCAKGIQLSRSAARIGIGSWLLLAGLLVLPLFSGQYLPVPAWVVPAVMAAASVVAWSCYRYDKQRAQSGQWRVRETHLHLVELLGGWPGAYLAQRRFRHKIRKFWFQFIFVSIVALHQIAAADVILGHVLSRTVLFEVREKLGVSPSHLPAGPRP
jgi:uncharacterized membrane protein YsdA (DUF1294 family)/cold shock CspA family protein